MSVDKRGTAPVAVLKLSEFHTNRPIGVGDICKLQSLALTFGDSSEIHADG